VTQACLLFNRFSGDDTLLTGVSEIYPTFYIFRIIWIKFDMGGVHKKIIGHYEFPEKRRIGSRTLDGTVHEFPYVLSTLFVWFGFSSV
jgi:hypothetical protein